MKYSKLNIQKYVSQNLFNSNELLNKSAQKTINELLSENINKNMIKSLIKEKDYSKLTKLSLEFTKNFEKYNQNKSKYFISFNNYLKEIKKHFINNEMPALNENKIIKKVFKNIDKITSKIPTYNNLLDNIINESYENISDDLYATKSIYDIERFLKGLNNNKNSLRLLYDKSINLWLTDFGDSYIHFDMLDAAYKAGYYSQFKNHYDFENYVNEDEWNDEPNMYRFKAHFNSPNIQEIIEQEKVDGYKIAYQYDTFTIVARSEYDLSETPLYKKLGKAKQIISLTENILKENDNVLNNTSFKKWFGNSKIVDNNDNPILCIHQTHKNFKQFNIKKSGIGNFGPGFYFSANEKFWDTYGGTQTHDYNNLECYLSIQNPFNILTPSTITEIGNLINRPDLTKYVIEKRGYDDKAPFYECASNFVNYAADMLIKNKYSDTKYKKARIEIWNLIKEQLIEQGYDGIYEGSPVKKGDIIVCWFPNQIKSINNNGNWSSESNNINESNQSFFANSGIVEANYAWKYNFKNGKPVTVEAYHSTPHNFSSFKFGNVNAWGEGIYLTNNYKYNSFNPETTKNWNHMHLYATFFKPIIYENKISENTIIFFINEIKNTISKENIEKIKNIFKPIKNIENSEFESYINTIFKNLSKTQYKNQSTLQVIETIKYLDKKYNLNVWGNLNIDGMIIAFAKAYDTFDKDMEQIVWYVCYKTNQIKSYDNNSGDYNLNSNNINENINDEIIAYHGTESSFDKFDINKQRINTFGKGFYFTNSKDEAKEYGDKVITVRLNIKNPLQLKDAWGVNDDLLNSIGIAKFSHLDSQDSQNKIKAAGYDSIIVNNAEGRKNLKYYIVFEPEQIQIIKNNLNEAMTLPIYKTGKPFNVIAYHGSPNVFNAFKQTTNTENAYGKGIYFYPRISAVKDFMDAEEYNEWNLYTCKISFKNPVISDSYVKDWEKNYDGLIIQDEYTVWEIIARNPEQIQIMKIDKQYNKLYESKNIKENNPITLIGYHGTTKNFDNFDTKFSKNGIYFASKKRLYSLASYYAKENGYIIKAKITLNNPFIGSPQEFQNLYNNHYNEMKKNYDGVISINNGTIGKSNYFNYKTKKLETEQLIKGDIIEIVAFNPEQIEIISKQKLNSEYLEEEKINLPNLEIGDEIKIGKYRNKKATIKDYFLDKEGQPNIKTNKGDRKLFNFKIEESKINICPKNKKYIII